MQGWGLGPGLKSRLIFLVPLLALSMGQQQWLIALNSQGLVPGLGRAPQPHAQLPGRWLAHYQGKQQRVVAMWRGKRRMGGPSSARAEATRSPQPMRGTPQPLPPTAPPAPFLRHLAQGVVQMAAPQALARCPLIPTPHEASPRRPATSSPSPWPLWTTPGPWPPPSACPRTLCSVRQPLHVKLGHRMQQGAAQGPQIGLHQQWAQGWQVPRALQRAAQACYA